LEKEMEKIKVRYLCGKSFAKRHCKLHLKDVHCDEKVQCGQYDKVVMSQLHLNNNQMKAQLFAPCNICRLTV